MHRPTNPVLLHLSDTHFGTERPEVVRALLALSAELKPELAVLSGDVTQRARRSQFEAAARFMHELTASAKLVLPGNHDLPLFNLWQRSTAPYDGFHAAFGPDLAPAYRSDRFLVLGVNTTRAWRHKHGEVSAEQIDGVVQRLQLAGPQQLRIVVTHQPMAVIRASDRRNLLRGREAAARAWADAGADVVLGGHIHLAYCCALDDDVLADCGRQTWVVQAGTAVSSRLRDGLPNSVNVLRHDVQPGGCICTVQQYDYDERQRCFRVTAMRRLDMLRAAPPSPGASRAGAHTPR